MRSVITRESFEEWQGHPVTSLLMKRLKSEREVMKEGLVNNQFENEDEIRGRCRVLAILLELSYEELMNNE